MSEDRDESLTERVASAAVPDVISSGGGAETLREGQRAFNELHTRDPELAEIIRGSDCDPFYDDSRLDAFRQRVQRVRPVRTIPDSHRQLLRNLTENLAELERLLGRVSDDSEDGEDLLYRFWHQSFKVYGLQQHTLTITDALAELAPTGTQLNGWYHQIVTEGTGHTFTLASNDDWLRATRPIVEAYLHALSLLRLAVRYGRQLDQVPHVLPSGWATLLHLYGIR
jgi:hypothetical protein